MLGRKGEDYWPVYANLLGGQKLLNFHKNKIRKAAFEGAETVIMLWKGTKNLGPKCKEPPN